MNVRSMLKNIDNVVKKLEVSGSYEHSLNNFKKVYEYVDIKEIEEPEILFKAHIPFSERPELIDVSIRYTVQMNLFIGSILNFGTEQHRKILENKNIIGSFGLTERNAGITSGFNVFTRCDMDSKTKKLKMNTGDYGNRKVWISQGLYAHYCVVFAQFYIDNVHQGIQPFLVNMRDMDGNLRIGINVKDMGEKYIITYLDNAEIYFDNLELDEDCIMNKRKCKNFWDIIDRLLTGRVILAECLLLSSKNTLNNFYNNYITKKEIILKDNYKITLSNLPYIKKIFDDYNILEKKASLLIKRSKDELCDSIRSNKRPSSEIVKLVNITKIFTTDSVYDTMCKVQKYLGSEHLLNYGTNPGLCTPFRIAEGDTLILRQKLVGDNMKEFKNSPIRFIIDIFLNHRTFKELKQVLNIYYSIITSIKSYEMAWIDNIFNIIELSDTIIDNEIKKNIITSKL